MKEIGSYAAKTHLPNLLDSVEAGESFIITRHGEPVAMLIPIFRDQLTPEQAVKQIQALRKGADWGGKGSTQEAKEEGRK